VSYKICTHQVKQTHLLITTIDCTSIIGTRTPNIAFDVRSLDPNPRDRLIDIVECHLVVLGQMELWPGVAPKSTLRRIQLNIVRIIEMGFNSQTKVDF
jgi:hypothetical protein